MDPKACMEELRRLARTISENGSGSGLIDRVWELLCAYSEWRRGGGFEAYPGADAEWRKLDHWYACNFPVY